MKDDVLYAKAALKFLYDHELFDNEALMNDMYTKTYVSKAIKDVDLLINQNTKQIFVFIELNIFGKKLKFFRNRIIMRILAFYETMLKQYKVKVFTEYSDFKKVKDQLIGEMGGN